MKEKALTVAICLIGVLSIAYGMMWHDNTCFILGLVFVIGGYLRIRKKLKESLQKKK